MITLGNMLLPAIMLFSPYPLLSCPKFFWASYADEFIIYWFHCLLIEPPTLSGLETHAADEHSPLLMENSLLAVKRRVLFCFFFTPLHYLSPLCFYLFNTSFTFYHLFLPLPPKCSEKQAKKLLAWFLKACFALIEQMALKGSLSLICWDLGRGPNPAGFCNSLILRHQVGIGSGQSLLCHATLLLSSLPPCPIGALAKERKPVWVGSSSCGFFFFPPSQVSSYLNELLCLLNLLCLALQAEGFPFFSCHEKTSRGGWGRCITSSLARRWDNGPAQVGLRGTGLLSLWPRRSWPWHRWPSAVCSRTPFLETPTVWDDHSSHGELSSPWTREKETQKGQSSAVCLLRHKHMAELCQWSSRCSKQL